MGAIETIAAAVTAWLFAPIAFPLGLATSWAEIGGFVAGAASVGLAARASIWNWPVGIVNSAFWLALFVSSGLYADGGLQAVYIALGIYGTWHWLKGGPKKSNDLPIEGTTPTAAIAVAAVTAAGVALGAWLLATQTNSTVPLLDSETTVVSLVATYLLARKNIENWPIWIFGVNLPYIGLYLGKGLALTASLQLVYIALSVAGWLRWRAELDRVAAPGLTGMVAAAVPVEAAL